MTKRLYSQLSVKEKVKFREILKELKEHCLKQKKLMTELWIKPIDHRLILLEKVTKNQITLEKFHKSNDKITDYHKKTMVDIKKYG